MEELSVCAFPSVPIISSRVPHWPLYFFFYHFPQVLGPDRTRDELIPFLSDSIGDDDAEEIEELEDAEEIEELEDAEELEFVDESAGESKFCDDVSVDTALKLLPESQRTALVLTYYQSLPNKEVSAIMGISTRAVESLLCRARAALRQQIEAQQCP